MNDQQKQAVGIAVAGHNLLILGTAGTGKSYTVKAIKERLNAVGKSVKITCSTGIACSVYSDAITVHRFLGLNDGRFGPDEINNIHLENPSYQFVDRNIDKTDCLIVDECSMISKRTFEMIHCVCSRKKERLQLIFCGDFMQLPPVPNERYMDFGDFCFQAQVFDSVFSHRITLSEPIRASEPLLLKAINDIFTGVLPEETKQFLISLKRPLQPGRESMKLFSNNHLVDGYNRNSLLKFPGEVFEHVSTDSGERRLLEKMAAPHTLWLKEGCPVILLQNLSDKLVNGLQGNVKSMSSDGITVTFDEGRLTSKIPRAKFSVFDPVTGTDIATREQYPLRLAFGLTIHKAQGMTLDRVEIDCRDIFSPGQLGVALSRAKVSSGLRVINFHPRYVLKPQQTVTEFLKVPGQDVLDDLSCCSSKIADKMPEGQLETEAPMLPQDPADSSSREDYSAPDPEDTAGEAEEMFFMDDEFDDVIKTIVSDEGLLSESAIPDDLIDKIQTNIFTEKEITPFQKNMNKLVARIDNPKLMLFVRKLLLKVQEFVKCVTDEEEAITKPIPEKNMNVFYEHVHKYSVGPEYKLNCMFLFENEEVITDEHMIVCYKILETIRVYCLKQKVDLVLTQGSKVPHRLITDTSKARIRYVAGFCVAKLRKKYLKKKKTNMFSKSKECQASYLDSESKLSILNLLKEDEQYLIDNTSQPDSLVDIIQKQGRKHGLTNVSDSFYSFFLQLTNDCLNLMVDENLMKYGSDLYCHCLDTLKNDKRLLDMFSSLVVSKVALEKLETFDQTESSDSTCNIPNVSSLFEEVTAKYLSVLLSQFRRDVKSAFKIEKKMAHRKQIKVASSKLKQPEPKRLRTSLNITKKNTATSSVLVDAQASTSKNKGQSLPASSTVTIADIEHSESVIQESASSIQLNLDNDDRCQKCFKDADDDFIECDFCDKWFHRCCVGLKSARLWKKFTKAKAKWSCENCS